ncbi:MAG TPA: hypothetical protein VKQ32_29560 [Polyangia bacterium]|nr:hypothetical protein [Polyangia bacterium]
MFTFTLAGRPTSAQPADEATRDEARKIGYAGVEAFQAGDFATAHDRLEAAYRLLQVPSLGLWSARALGKLGKLVEADARYLEVIRLPTSVGDEAIQAQARQDAERERGELARRIPSIQVRVQGAPVAEVAVTIDGAPVVGSALGDSQLVNPGHHRIEGVRGATRAHADVDVAEGEQREAALGFAAPTAEAGSGGAADAGLRAQSGASTGGGPMRTVGWVTLGAGGAGLATGVVTALIVRSKKNHLDGVGCGDGGQNCPVSEASNVDSFNSWRPVPTISLIAGALLSGAGAYLLLTTPAPGGDAGSAQAATARPRLRPLLFNVRLAVLPGGTTVSGEF